MHTNPKSLNSQPYILGVEQAGAGMHQGSELQLSDADWHRIGGGLERLLTPEGPQRLLEMQHLCAYLLQLIAYSSYAPAYLTGGYWEHQGANLPPVFESADGRISPDAQNRAILALARHIVSRINAQPDEFAPLAPQKKFWPTLAPATIKTKRGRGRPLGSNSIRTSRISALVRKIDCYRRADKVARESGKWLESWFGIDSSGDQNDPWANFFDDEPLGGCADAREAYRQELSFYGKSLAKPRWFKSAAFLPPLRSAPTVIEQWENALCELIKDECGKDYLSNPIDPKIMASREILSHIFKARGHQANDSSETQHQALLERYLFACRRFNKWPETPIELPTQRDQRTCHSLPEIDQGLLKTYAMLLPKIPANELPVRSFSKRNPYSSLEESDLQQLQAWWDAATPAASQWIWLIRVLGKNDAKFQFIWSRMDISSIGQSGKKLNAEINKVLEGLAKGSGAKRI